MWKIDFAYEPVCEHNRSQEASMSSVAATTSAPSKHRKSDGPAAALFTGSAPLPGWPDLHDP